MPCRAPSRTDTRPSPSRGKKSAIRKGSRRLTPPVKIDAINDGGKTMNITVELLTSKRVWIGLVMFVAALIRFLYGIEVDEATKQLAVNQAIDLGTLATELIGTIALMVTKVVDDKNKG